ncbi:hypothetical protein MTO96_039219 [Rhipicephalus appendiculatus]
MMDASGTFHVDTGDGRRTVRRTLIVQAAKEAPFITAREIKDSLNLSASMSIIRRRLHEMACGAMCHPKSLHFQRPISSQDLRLLKTMQPGLWKTGGV